MKQIIPFKKELPFKTKVCEVTSISLEREINVTDDGVVTGAFHITGDYKMNEGSINRENFSFDLPFDITLDPRYDIKTVNSDIEDFYYDVINEDTLKVNIDLYVEAEYLSESLVKSEDVTLDIEKDDEREVSLEEEKDTNKDMGDDLNETTKEVVTEDIEEVREDIEDTLEKEDTYEEVLSPSVEYEPKVSEELPIREDDSFAYDLFSNLDATETYTTYYVYIVKEDDTIDKILTKYEISKDDLESYNDITDIKPGDKVIIPKKSE